MQSFYRSPFHIILQIMTNNINLQITFSCRPTCKLRLTGLSGTHGDSSSSSSNLFTSASILNGLSSKLTARPIFFDFFVKVFLKAFPSSCTSSSSSPPSLSFRAHLRPSLSLFVVDIDLRVIGLLNPRGRDIFMSKHWGIALWWTFCGGLLLKMSQLEI